MNFLKKHIEQILNVLIILGVISLVVFFFIL